jgi:DNA invertase Pin-like site-specific DNA recombinase
MLPGESWLPSPTDAAREPDGTRASSCRLGSTPAQMRAKGCILGNPRFSRSILTNQLVVFKLDRLGRSLAHLALILDELQWHGIALIATSQGIDTSNSNPVGRLQLNVLMAVAEFEREIIRERVNAGLAAARARGVKLGRRPTHSWTPQDVRGLKAQGLGVRAISRQLQMPVSSVSAMLRSEPEVKAA